MLKVGAIVLNDDGEVESIEREYFRQGNIFKDEDAYRNHKDKPCYVPELSDSVYTAQDFLDMCNGQQNFADDLFDGVDWQHPESLKEDWFMNNEWVECECGIIVDYGDGCNDTKCPHCGKEINQDE